MTESVDNRVVQLEFDNKDFAVKIDDTLKALQDLTKALQFEHGKEGFADVQHAADQFNTGGMESALDHISGRLSAMGAIGFTVIQDLTNGFFNAAKKLSTIVFDPIANGGKQRAINIDNAKFAFRGLGLDVDAAMASAKKAVLGTAYGLDEAAKAAAQFGASGIKVGDQMTQALRGIAGAAAITNTSFGEISQIFTGIAGANRVTNQDFLQFATRGLNAAAIMAKQLGKTEAQVHQMATDGTIDFAMFSKAMDDALGAHAQDANQTFQGALANMHAAMSRLGAAFQSPLLEQKRDIFNALTPAIDNVSKALGPLINLFTFLTKARTGNLIGFIHNFDFARLTLGVALFTNGLTKLLGFLGRIGKIGKGVFDSIFPGSASKHILDLLHAFFNFTERLRVTKGEATALIRIFGGFFSGIKIGIAIVKDIIGVLRFLFRNPAATAAGGVLGFLSKIGQWFIDLKKKLIDGNELLAWFLKLAVILKKPGDKIAELRDKVLELKDAIADFFHGGKGGKDIHGLPERLDILHGKVSGFQKLLEKVTDFIHHLGDKWDEVKEKAGHALDRITGALKTIKSAAETAGGHLLEGLKIGSIIGLLAGLEIIIKNFLDNGVQIAPIKDLFGKVSGVLDQLKSTLKSLQTEIKADVLMRIAKAIALLTISVLVLSFIDAGKLAKALSAIAVGFGELAGTMAILNQIAGDTKGAAKLFILSLALSAIAAAIILLSIAVKLLSTIKMGDLAKGLLGVTILLIALTESTKLIAKDTDGLITAGIAMIAISIALVLVAEAVKKFGKMDFGSMMKGLLAVGLVLAAFVITSRLMDPAGMLGASVGILVISGAMIVLAKATEMFASMKFGDMVKGLAGVGAMLLIIAGTMALMPGPSLILTAAGLLLVSIALDSLAATLFIIGKMKIETLLQGLIGMGTALLIIALGCGAMEGALPGALAMIVVAGALDILAGVLKTLGSMSIGSLVTSIVALAAAMVVIGVVGSVLGVVSPLLAAFGAALILVGAGFVLFGAGVYLVGTGLQALAKAGSAGVKAFISIINEFLAAIPGFIQTLLTSIFNGLGSILKTLPGVISALVKILGMLLDGLVVLIPKLVKFVGALISGLVNLIKEHAVEIIDAGFFLIEALLTGLDKNIDKITNKAVDILIKFINAITSRVNDLAAAATLLIVAFIDAVGNNSDQIITSAVDMLVKFIGGISDNSGKIVEAVTILIITFIGEVGGSATQIAQAGTDALVQFLNGLSADVDKITQAVGVLIITFIGAVAGLATQVAASGTDALVQFLAGMTNNVQKVTDAVGVLIVTFIGAVAGLATQITNAGADAIISFVTGIGNRSQDVINAGVNTIIKLINGLGQAALQLADAGASAAIKFVNGLADVVNTRSAEFDSAMNRLIGAIANAITGGLAGKAKDFIAAGASVAQKVLEGVAGPLGFLVKSPSKRMLEIAGHVVAGLVQGLHNDKTAERSGAGFASRVHAAISGGLAKIPAALENVGDFNPTITPVLDLSNVENEAAKLAGLLSVNPIAPGASLNSAHQIAHTKDDVSSSDIPPKDPPVTNNNFTQNNYSPKALTTGDIYRKTKSQIALAKTELELV